MSNTKDNLFFLFDSNWVMLTTLKRSETAVETSLLP